VLFVVMKIAEILLGDESEPKQLALFANSLEK
jgi:hypothetical protein